MATEHMCEGEWRPGKVSSCPKHQTLKAAKRVKYGPRASRKADREAGVIGTDRGGFISGH